MGRVRPCGLIVHLARKRRIEYDGVHCIPDPGCIGSRGEALLSKSVSTRLLTFNARFSGIAAGASPGPRKEVATCGSTRHDLSRL
jgi:hypothetical protein